MIKFKKPFIPTDALEQHSINFDAFVKYMKIISISILK